MKSKNMPETASPAMTPGVFHALVENAADFVALCTPAGQIMAINENGRMLFTLFDESEIAKLNLIDLVVEDEQMVWETAVTTATETGVWQGELNLRSMDGIETPFSLRLIAHNNTEGQLTTLTLFGADITDRKWIEESLLESETRFRSSFENTSLGMALLTNEGRFLQVNAAMTNMLGYTQQEFMSLSIFDLLHPEDITKAAPLPQDLQTGQVAIIKGDMRYQRKDQETLWASLNSTAIQDAKGYVPYFLVQIQDITEQKIAETQLQATLVSQQQQLEISHAFAAAQTEDEVLDVIIQKAAIYPQAAVSITYWETDDEGEHFDIVQRQNVFESGIETAPEGSRTPWKESPIANHYTADDFFISNDLPQDSQLHQSVRKSFAGAGINSLAIFPIVASGDWLGNIAVMSKEQDFFSTQVTSLFRFLAEQGSIALRATILFAKTQRSLERRNREVALTIQIAQDVATASNLTDLYKKVVDQVQEQFHHYHVQLLRYDAFLDTVALIYGYGETGQKMVALNHSMPLGVGLIGAAAATAQTTYRGNVAQDPDWRPNPLLPNTRSEIAVPIKLRNEVLGVLDVQSDRLNAFNEEDQLLLEGLCGQIAIAIESTRLREEMDTRINELTTLQRYMSREGWESYQRIKQGAVSGYQFDHQGVAALVDTLDLNIQPGNGESGERETAVSPTHTETSLTVLGGEVIGKLGVHTDDNDPLSEDELDFIQSISAQVAEALEAARLFEQTQDALSEQERLSTQLETVAQVSTAAATMLEVDALLQAVVDLTKASFNLYHTHIYLMGYNDHTLVLRAGADQVGRLMTLEGRQIRLSDESIVARAARQKDGIVENDVRKIVDFLPNPLLPHTRAELAVPLIIGDKVIGVLDLQADQTDFFTEEDVNIHRTLASQIAVAVQNASLFAEQIETSQKLREVDRVKTEFLASMSHELRTPLNSIIGFADVLLEGLDGELNERMEEDVRLIRDSGNHLRALIGDILDMSKIEAGRMELRYEEIDIVQMAHDIIATASPLAEAKNLALHLNLSDEVDTVEADRTRLRQILWNIMGNAIKFTQAGSVTLSVARQGQDLLFGIRDTGIGIDEENVSIVFEQFRQIDGNLNRSVGGTGLGMPITRRLVELHGGEIWIESIMGQGSTFWFTVPIHQYYRLKKADTGPLLASD